MQHPRAVAVVWHLDVVILRRSIDLYTSTGAPTIIRVRQLDDTRAGTVVLDGGVRVHVVVADIGEILAEV